MALSGHIEANVRMSAGHRRLAFVRKRGQYLGTVEAPSERTAEAAPVAEFDLSDEQRRRLVVSEGN